MASKYQFPVQGGYYVPQIYGPDGTTSPQSIFGVRNGNTGTIASIGPNDNLVNAPSGFDFFGARGVQQPGIYNNSTGQIMSVPDPKGAGMPTGQGYFSPTGFQPFNYDQTSKDGSLFDMPGLGILGPYAALAGPGFFAGAAGAGTGGITADSIASGITGGENASGAMYGANALGGTGGSMWDLIDQLTGGQGLDANPLDITGNTSIPGTAPDVATPWGMPTGPGTQDWWSQLGLNSSDVGGAASGLPSGLTNAPTGIQNFLKNVLGLGGSGTGTGTGTGSGGLGGGLLGSAFNASPFLLALSEANKQGGNINQTIGRMQGLYDQAGTNQGPFMDSVIQPYRQQTMAGLDSLNQNLGQRNVLGSSFGDQAINSYNTTRGLGEGELAAKALTSSLGLQGGLAGDIGKLQTQAATNRNLLLGAGLNASGSLFKPTDPFGIQQLQANYLQKLIGS